MTIYAGAGAAITSRTYDISPDGSRFLMVRTAERQQAVLADRGPELVRGAESARAGALGALRAGPLTSPLGAGIELPQQATASRTASRV